jgi:hypothetical protein
MADFRERLAQVTTQPGGALVDQVLAGSAPRHLRLAAARGALPLPRPMLVRLYVALRSDADREIATQAQGSLDGLDPAGVLEVLADEECAPEVLDFYATPAARNEAMAERIAFHRAVWPRSLATLAGAGNSSVIDLVLTNQQRLLSNPDVLDRLAVNPSLRPEQRGRILELLDRATRAADAQPGDEAVVGQDGQEIPPEVREAARLLQVDIGELFAASEILDGEEFAESEDPAIRTAYHRILTLNTAQKAVLAMRGGREERQILVRDTNRLVALGVLRNPRLTEEDVEGYARMRAVAGDVLREIGQNREWTKGYPVVNALVNNPKTPQGVAMNIVARLQNQDLRRLVANHDVPELIRRMAKRTLDTRTQSAEQRRRH